MTGQGRRRGDINIDWSDLETLALKHTTAEIAEIKGCSRQSVSNTLTKKGLRRRRGPRSLKDKLKAVVDLSKIRIMCKECGKRLEVTPWNNITNMACCDNFRCGLFRNPVMHPKLRIEKVSYA